jgi:RimJ/RimL family protein N-acetyltransferase
VARNDSPKWPRLYTGRLCLRPWTPQDAEALYDLFADEEVMGGLNREPVSAVAEARAIVEQGIAGWRADGVGPFILRTKSTGGQVVGQAGLMIFDRPGRFGKSESRFVTTLLGVTRLFTPQLLVILEATAVG